MIPKRPINADVPEPRDAAPEEAPAEEDSGKPGTPKALIALVVLALVFIVAAIVWGSGGGDDSEAPAPAPTPTTSEGGR